MRREKLASTLQRMTGMPRRWASQSAQRTKRVKRTTGASRRAVAGSSFVPIAGALGVAAASSGWRPGAGDSRKASATVASEADMAGEESERAWPHAAVRGRRRHVDPETIDDRDDRSNAWAAGAQRRVSVSLAPCSRTALGRVHGGALARRATSDRRRRAFTSCFAGTGFSRLAMASILGIQAPDASRPLRAVDNRLSGRLALVTGARCADTCFGRAQGAAEASARPSHGRWRRRAATSRCTTTRPARCVDLAHPL